MTRSICFRSPLLGSISGVILASALTLAPQLAFAQHGGGHAGGFGGHAGGFGGGHFSGGGHVSAPSHVSAPPHVAPPSHVISSPAAGASTSSGPIHVVSGSPARPGEPSRSFNSASYPGTSSGLPAGLAMFAEHAPATVSGAHLIEQPRHVTIGFPPSTALSVYPDEGRAMAGNWAVRPGSPVGAGAPAPASPAGGRRGGMSFSGQGHEIWQNAIRTVPPPVAPQKHPPVAVVPGPPWGSHPHVFPPGWTSPGFPIFWPGTGLGWWWLGWEPGGGPGWGFGNWGCAGWGWNGCGYGSLNGWGWGSGCDPNFDLNCGAYAPYGYSNNSVSSGGYSSSDDTSRMYGPYSSQEPPSSPANPPAESATPETLIYLNDGTTYSVKDYWLSGSKLYYITNYGAESSVKLSNLDVQRTVDENATRGVSFTLRPAPVYPDGGRAPAAGPAPDGPQPPAQQ